MESTELLTLFASGASTSDVVDEIAGDPASCDTQFRQFGAHCRFSGRVRTLRCHEDNALLKDTLRTPGEGAVLVVDGGGSLHCALVGDIIAQIGVDSGWAGLILNGAVRDVAALRQLPLGVKALGSNPRRSQKSGAGERDVPVSFGGVTFRPGNTVFSDQDGVVLVDF